MHHKLLLANHLEIETVVDGQVYIYRIHRRISFRYNRVQVVVDCCSSILSHAVFFCLWGWYCFYHDVHWIWISADYASVPSSWSTAWLHWWKQGLLMLTISDLCVFTLSFLVLWTDLFSDHKLQALRCGYRLPFQDSNRLLQKLRLVKRPGWGLTR